MKDNYEIVSFAEHSKKNVRKRYIAAAAALAVAGYAVVFSFSNDAAEDVDDMSVAETAVTAVSETAAVTEATTAEIIPVADKPYIPDDIDWVFTTAPVTEVTEPETSVGLSEYEVSQYEYYANEKEEYEENDSVSTTVTETETEAETETVTEVQTEAETETETEVQTEAETEIVSETEAMSQEIVNEASDEDEDESDDEYVESDSEDEIGDEIFEKSGVDPESVDRVSRFDIPDWLELDDNGVPVNYTEVHTGKSCAYTAEPGALMSTGKAVFQGYVAVDPDIIPYGSELYIIADDGQVYGYAIAADTGYSVSVGDIIVDLFMDEYDDCICWGAKNVTIYVLK